MLVDWIVNCCEWTFIAHCGAGWRTHFCVCLTWAAMKEALLKYMCNTRKQTAQQQGRKDLSRRRIQQATVPQKIPMPSFTSESIVTFYTEVKCLSIASRDEPTTQ